MSVVVKFVNHILFLASKMWYENVKIDWDQNILKVADVLFSSKACP